MLFLGAARDVPGTGSAVWKLRVGKLKIEQGIFSLNSMSGERGGRKVKKHQLGATGTSSVLMVSGNGTMRLGQFRYMRCNLHLVGLAVTFHKATLLHRLPPIARCDHICSCF